jgi:hypothetical protein
LLAGGRDALALDVSVIIPTFRRPSQLAQAIASVRAQRHVALEIIIVDDCPEGSAEQVVAAAADPRLTYIRNPCPSGGRPGAVRNLAWPLAQGGIVHFNQMGHRPASQPGQFVGRQRCVEDAMASAGGRLSRSHGDRPARQGPHRLPPL